MKTYKSNMRRISLREEKSEYKKVKIKCSKDAYEVLKPFYEKDMTLYESFFMLFLNQAGNTTGFVKISQGGIAGTVADVRVIAKYAIETLSPSVMIAHNHPSGNLQPSEPDKHITRKIKDTLKLFDCNLLDHIILTEDSYFSFADNGMM